MMPVIQCEPPVFIRPGTVVFCGIKGSSGKRDKGSFIFTEQFRDSTSFIIVLAFHVPVARPEKIFILLFKGLKLRNRDKFIASQIPDLVLDVALFPSGFRIHENRLEAVMLSEPAETFIERAVSPFQDLPDDGPGVVKPDLRGNPADVFEHSLHAFQKALEVLAIVELQVGTVAVRETEYKVFALPIVPSVFNKVSCTEIGLCLTGMMQQGNVAFQPVHAELLLFLRYVFSDQAVTAVEVLRLCFQTPKDPLCGMPLLSGKLFILRQPFVDDRLKRIQLGFMRYLRCW